MSEPKLITDEELVKAVSIFASVANATDDGHAEFELTLKDGRQFKIEATIYQEEIVEVSNDDDA